MLSGIGGNAIYPFAPQIASTNLAGSGTSAGTGAASGAASGATQNPGNLFATIDSNGDGKISPAELASFLNKMTASGSTQPGAAGPSGAASTSSANALIDQLRTQLATSAAMSASTTGAAASAAVSSSPAAKSTASAATNQGATSATHHHHHHGAGSHGATRAGSAENPIASQLVQQYQQTGASPGVNAGSALSAIA